MSEPKVRRCLYCDKEAKYYIDGVFLCGDCREQDEKFFPTMALSFAVMFLIVLAFVMFLKCATPW